MGRVVSLADAVALVEDGAAIGVGGVLLQRKPLALLDALAAAGRRGLRLWSFLASLDVELLAAHGALAETRTGYVGFEQLGFAPAYEAAVAAGRVEPHEYSECLFVSGLRAALAGLPYLPTKGALGSELVDELGLVELPCPYTGEVVIAAPALRPDVALVHAEAADEDGNVLGPEDPEFLYDLDANVARAAGTAIVSVERLVGREEARRSRSRVLLFGYETDAVVVVPGGARPGAVPGRYEADLGALRAYLERARSEPGAAAGAARELMGR